MGVYRVPIELGWTGGGTPGVNVWHVRTVIDPPAGDLQQMVDHIHTFYESVEPVLRDNTTLSMGDVVDVVDSTYQAVDWVPITVSNEVGSAPLSNQIVVAWRTSLAARRGMGRTFVGPLCITPVDLDGSPTAAALTVVRDAAAALVAASVSVADGAIAVWGLEAPNPFPDQPSADLPHVARDIVGSRVRDQFAVLRSRRD